MHFLFIKVINVNYKEDILLALQSVGINKASLFNATDLDPSLNQEFPFFRGFFRSEEDRESEQLIITALVEDKKQVKKLVQNLSEADVDVQHEPVIRVILMPVEMIFDHENGFQDF